MRGLDSSLNGTLDCRTVVEIQGRVTGKGERSLLSRLVHAKNDKEAIDAWKADLNGILRIFNVRSAGSPPLSLTSPLRPS